MKIKSKIVTILFLLLIILINSKAEVFPVAGGEADDFSSSFGPRNNNGYDFHEGLDIGNVSVGTNVYAISKGVVYFKGPQSVILYHEEEYNDYTKYLHIVPSVSENDTVDEGEIVGTIKTMDQPHLHFGWFPETAGAPNANETNADNPVHILWQAGFANLTPKPKIVDKNGNEYGSGDHIDIYLDEDSNGKYFKFGVRAEDDELDIHEIQVHLSGYDYDGTYYQSSDLLKDGNEISQPNVVYYHTQNHCDVAHPYTCLFIEPNVFYRTDPYHTVYFKWYIDEEAFNDVNEYVTVEIDLWDRVNDAVIVNNLRLPTCIDCHPPASAPGPPTLISANYIQDSRSIKLEYEQDWSSPAPAYFKIYRCLSSETMTDDDVIGISTSLSEYYDDSNELKPGISYKYAVAGVNYTGEGYNSNQLSDYFGEELGATISANRTLDGIYYSNGTTINTNIILTVNEGTEIYFNDDAQLKVYGTLISIGASGNPIIYSSLNATQSAGDWYGIRFENSSVDASCILKYCEIKYATYGVYAYYASPSIHSCWIHDNTYGLLGASSSMVVTNNKIYNNSQDGGYFYRGTPKFYTNTIYDNTGNGFYFYSSSGKIGYSSGTSQGLNEIRDNGSWGIYAQELTEIFMGSSDSEGNRIGGYNSVMDNTINEVCSNAAHVEAEYNYWGTSSPTSGLFTLVYGGTIDYVPYLTSDPNGGSSLAKRVNLSGSDNIADNSNNRWAGYNPANLNFDKLSDFWLYGLELTLHNRPEKAIEIYKMLIEKFPKSTEAKKAMVKVHHLLRECDEKSQENYFETLMQKEGICKEEYKSTAMTLAAYTYCDMGLPVQAINIFEEVIKEYPDSSCALGALFNLVMLNLNSIKDASTASAYLEIMKQKYPCEAQTLIARTDMGEDVDWYVLSKKQTPQPETMTDNLPTDFKLYNNYPNPFNPMTNIKFDLPEETHVTLTVYDINGREVAQLVNQNMNAGYQNIIWDAKDKFGCSVASGFYIYQMRTSAGFIKTNKMILMR